MRHFLIHDNVLRASALAPLVDNISGRRVFNADFAGGRGDADAGLHRLEENLALRLRGLLVKAANTVLSRHNCGIFIGRTF